MTYYLIRCKRPTLRNHLERFDDVAFNPIVEFVNAEDAAAAYEAKKGFELDNRPINLDWASAKPQNQDGQK